MQIVIASRNLGKIREIREIFTDLDVELLSLSDLPSLPPITEDGDTFEANAIIKAAVVCKLTRKWTIADDSGLEVKALDGAPGVNSARYASLTATDTENIEKLLAELKDIPQAERKACFRAVIVLINPEGEKFTAEGKVCGRITDTPRGDNGFGYDPVFFLPEYNKTMAEIPGAEKNRISHRARALETIKEKIKDILKV